MSLQVKDAGSNTINLKTTTDGSDLVPHHISQQSTHDDLNVNANLQVGDVDVSNSNKVPTSETNSSTIAGHLATIADVIVSTGFATDGESMQVAGTDGSNARVIALDTNGKVKLSSQSETINVFLSDGAISELGQLSSVEVVDVVTQVQAVTSIVPGTANTQLGKAEDSAHSSGSTGVMVLGVRRDVPSVDTSTPGDYAAIQVNPSGSLWTANAPATNSSQSSVAGNASSTTILSSNGARKGATVFNDSGANLYLKLGATASTTSFSVLITASGYYEVPFGYSGTIDGIWSAATGNARITELMY